MNFKNNLNNTDIKANTQFINELRSKLPQFFNENNNFNIQKFENSLLQNNINEFRDGYTLNYVGKEYAHIQAGQPTKTVIVPDNINNKKDENINSKNLFLTGDNIDVLKHLQKSYTNSIDVIYIDPPYNTGSDGFEYNDSFDLSDDTLRNILNTTEKDIEHLHMLNGKSSHSAWLTFMYPRLKIAQQLLSDDGIIFISIDDNEQANLKLLMDDIFGSGNFITDFIWEKTQHFGRQKLNYYNNADHIITYGKNTFSNNKLKESLVEFEKKDFTDAPLYNDGNNQKSLTFPKNTVKFHMRDGKYSISTDDKYKLLNPVIIKNGYNDNEFSLMFKSRWSNETVKKELRKGTTFLVKTDHFAIRAVYGGDKVSRESPRQIIFTNQNNPSKTSSRFNKRVDVSENASSALVKLMGGKYFSYPKPSSLIEYLISLYFKNGMYPKDINVLDFFAGSATTAEAIMHLNSIDNGNRSYILATLDENVDSKVAKDAGYNTIDQISRERIRLSAKKIKHEHPEWTGDTGFKNFYIKDMKVQTVDKIKKFDPNNLNLFNEDILSEFGSPELETKGSETILQTWLINDGYKFNTKTIDISLLKNNATYVPEGNILYIINEFSQDDVQELLNKIGNLDISINTIIVFGYSLSFATMTSLKTNVKNSFSGVNVEVRY